MEIVGKPIKGFILNNGQQVVTEINDEGIWIYPLYFELRPNPQGGNQPITMVNKLLQFAKENIIDPNDEVILGTWEPSDQAKRMYTEITKKMKLNDAGLVTPDMTPPPKNPNITPLKPVS